MNLERAPIPHIAVCQGAHVELNLDLPRPAYYTVEVRDRHGLILARRTGPSRSWLRQYVDLLCVQMGQAAQNVRDINNALNSESASLYHLTMRPVGTDTADQGGTVVGSGSTAVTISDYKLGTQIAHGSAAGQLSHQPMIFSSPSISAPNISFTLDRSFINNSGGLITVREIGIYARASTHHVAIVRDVLTSPAAVPAGSTLRVIYTITQTSPPFVKNWSWILYCHASYQTAGGPLVQDTSGANQTFNIHANDWAANSGIGVVTFGPVAGTSDTAETINDYAIGALIGEGAGAGQFNYQATSVSAVTISGSEAYFTVQRMANNNSGGTITVKEIALYVKGTSTPYYFCIARKVLATPVDVPNLNSFTMTFTVKVSA